MLKLKKHARTVLDADDDTIARAQIRGPRRAVGRPRGSRRGVGQDLFEFGVGRLSGIAPASCRGARGFTFPGEAAMQAPGNNTFGAWTLSRMTSCAPWAEHEM